VTYNILESQAGFVVSWPLALSRDLAGTVSRDLQGTSNQPHLGADEASRSALRQQRHYWIPVRRIALLQDFHD
jgi:hypothetical protein